MERPKVYSLRLTDDELFKLNKVIKNKATCKTALKRCQILMDLDETNSCGLTHAQIAHTCAVCLRLSQILSETMLRKVLTETLSGASST